MKYWEFLIQKEGDQTWLPLETQQVEILEGRYRVVAHTDRLNMPVEIRVSQMITDEMPPRQRVRRRTSSTNESGLVVVMPFVQLKPGQWKLKCSSVEGTDNMPGDHWQYDVQLQVFAQNEGDWLDDGSVLQEGQSASSVLIDGADSDEPLANADLPLIQAQAELQQRVGQGADGEAAQTVLGRSSNRAYQIALRQQAYLSQRDQPMAIMGKVSALTPVPGEAASQLWIRLQNPETAGVIMEAHRPLSLARLPADFKVQIQLPNDVKTRVVLGEVSLRTAASNGERPAQVLASTAFTITVGIDQILDAIANQDSGTFEEEISPLSHTNGADSASTRESSGPSFDMSSQPSAPAERTMLPPQVEQRLESEPIGESLDELPTQIGSRLIDLPTFNQTTFNQTTFNQTTFNQVAFNPIPLGQQSEIADEQLNYPPDQVLAEPPDDLDANVDLSTVSDANSSDFNTPAVEGEPQASSSQPSMPPVPMPSMVSAPAQFMGTSIEESDLEADEIAAVLDNIKQDLLEEPSDLDALEAPGVEGVVDTMPRTSGMIEAEIERVPDSTTLSAEEEFKSSQRLPARKSEREVEANLAFQSLKLKDHFWQRLSTLNRQSHEEAAKLAESMEAAGVQRLRGDGGLLASSTSSAVEDYAGDEVVIYDEPPVPDESVSKGADVSLEARLRTSSTLNDSVNDSTSRYGDRSAKIRSRRERSALPASPLTSGQAMNEANPATFQKRPGALDEDLPEMALPVISLPMGDLVAGQMVTVTVRSRPSTYKPFIKLWMVDRQSRNLVIDPKILTDLTRDALGDLQGTTELQVPMDCLDVQIAAIAIDMATQQESGKAIVSRRVVPPDQYSMQSRFNL